MKKTILVVAMALISSVAFGQIQKGDIQLGGSLLFNGSDTNDFETSNFQISPGAALFLSDKTSIGLNLGLRNNTIKRPAGDDKTNSFDFGVYARFHKNVSERFYFFLQPGVSIGTGTQENVNFANDFDISSFNVNITPGVIYFLSDKFALESTMGGFFYSNNKTEGNGIDQSTDNYGLNFNLSNVTVGASFYLRK